MTTRSTACSKEEVPAETHGGARGVWSHQPPKQCKHSPRSCFSSSPGRASSRPPAGMVSNSNRGGDFWGRGCAFTALQSHLGTRRKSQVVPQRGAALGVVEQGLSRARQCRACSSSNPTPSRSLLPAASHVLPARAADTSPAPLRFRSWFFPRQLCRSKPSACTSSSLSAGSAGGSEGRRRQADTASSSSVSQKAPRVPAARLRAGALQAAAAAAHLPSLPPPRLPRSRCAKPPYLTQAKHNRGHSATGDSPKLENLERRKGKGEELEGNGDTSSVAVRKQGARAACPRGAQQ